MFDPGVDDTDVLIGSDNAGRRQGSISRCSVIRRGRSGGWGGLASGRRALFAGPHMSRLKAKLIGHTGAIPVRAPFAPSITRKTPGRP